MSAEENLKSEEWAQRAQEGTHSDARRLLSTLDGVFSTFRQQLGSEVQKPFTGAAKIAVDTFSDIVAGLNFESRRPRAVTISAARVSHTEVDLSWEDFPNNAEGYRVERCEGYNCHDLEEIALLPATARSFRDDGATERLSYRYRVVVFDTRGETSSNLVEVSESVVLTRGRSAHV